ncbi:protein translocase subunit SecDF [Sungkyunkwania multivorans]|uniref:Multifunctional fusion protein n=1 Tax=Sungkyunkwania multivorans TaxID=1173618 RepID=A0ABW3CSA2_9FLAO
MQNKGLVKLFAFLFGLVSIYQLSFTFFTNSVENEAEEYAINKVDNTVANYVQERAEVEAKYLDSVANAKKFIGFTYAEAKKKELNKGLDLKGGINVILQISVKDILKGLAEKSKDPTFNTALENADQLQKNADEPYVESFFEAFDAIKGDKKLASPDIFANRTLDDDIDITMDDETVKKVIREKVDDAIVSAFEVLRKRIDEFGVTQPNIQRLGNSGRILVELPGAKDVQRARELVSQTAQLEFWETYNTDKLVNFLTQANNLIREEQAPKAEKETTEAVQDTTATAEEDTSSKIDALLDTVDTDSTAVEVVANPIFDLDVREASRGRNVLGVYSKEDGEKVVAYLNRPDIRALLPAEMRYTKFLLGREVDLKAYEGRNVRLLGQKGVELYAINANRDNTPPLSGDVITDAQGSFSQNGEPSVDMQMNTRGSKIWEDMTGKASKENTNIAIVLDDIVYSAPGVSKGAIVGGRSEISGDFTILETKDLANVLRAGKLPASADIIQSEIVGPSLGQEAIDSGIMSFLIALSLVLIWMVFYYGKAGIFADIALALNILLIFGVLAGLGAVLTLPGIAGIVLTIGMSVDANVLIFERVREELTKGKGMKQAVADGFNNALSSILDANITTGLTALILFIFGTGPIKGFATTLLVGIVTSLFTAIFITRLFVDWQVEKGNKLDFATAMTKNLFRNMTVDFLGKRKVAYIISFLIVAGGLASLATQGLNPGVDFSGGRSYVVRFEKSMNASEVSNTLADVFVEDGVKLPPNVKTFGEDNQLKITTKYKIDVSGTEVDEEVEQKLFEGLKSYLPADFTLEQFVDSAEDKEIGRMSSVKVGPTIADDIFKASLWSIFGSLIVVFLYILLRFRRWQFSLGAVAAVFHDVLIVLGVFSIFWKIMPFNMEIDQAFIAAILTVIGYSLNDTVVVFDRIREFMNDHPTWEFSKTVNSALNSTLSRTLNTSLTTLVVLLAIFIFGGESIRGFMFALIVGVLVGTYSSLFIATPVMYDTTKKADKEKT